MTILPDLFVHPRRKAERGVERLPVRLTVVDAQSGRATVNDKQTSCVKHGPRTCGTIRHSLNDWLVLCWMRGCCVVVRQIQSSSVFFCRDHCRVVV